MLRCLSILFGIILIFFGVGAYFPQLKHNGLLFGQFEFDQLHRLLIISTGVIAIMSATHRKYSQLFFQICGVIFALVALIGFWRSGNLFLFHVNMPDNFLNLGFAIVTLYIGFAMKRQ